MGYIKCAGQMWLEYEYEGEERCIENVLYVIYI